LSSFTLAFFAKQVYVRKFFAANSGWFLRRKSGGRNNIPAEDLNLLYLFGDTLPLCYLSGGNHEQGMRILRKKTSSGK
jgi:hypothetical protein